MTFSEKTLKQLQLAGAIGAPLLALIAIPAELYKKFLGLTPETLSGTALALVVLGIWLFAQWRSRHSRLARPEALRIDRNNAQHLVGREGEAEDLRGQCLGKPIVFLEGESGSGKSALVRVGLLPGLKDDKTVLPLLLDDIWVDQWERGPSQGLKAALIRSGALDGSVAAEPAIGKLTDLADIERALVWLNDEKQRTPLLIFDQFDDYQARNQARFLPQKTWLDPAALRRQNPFWDMTARLLEREKIRCLFVTRNDKGAGLASVAFLGPVQAVRLDKVPSDKMSGLLLRLTEAKPDAPVIIDPEAGWNRLRERIIQDISQQNVILPQQLKTLLGGLPGLKRLSVGEYERAGGASGVEALYVEQQVAKASRLAGVEPQRVRSLLVSLVDPPDPSKTQSRSRVELEAIEPPFVGNQLTEVIQELERSEIVRPISDWQQGQTRYQLDHDYLARGVVAAERRANAWRYQLEEGSKALEKAGSMSAKWRSLLPLRAQGRLAWERLQGQSRFRYGQHRDFALKSLARLAPIALMLVAAVAIWIWNADRREAELARETARSIWAQVLFRNEKVQASDIDGLWMLAHARDPRVRDEFVKQLLLRPSHAETFLIKPDLVVQSLIGISTKLRDRIASQIVDQLNKDPYSVTSLVAAFIVVRLSRFDRLNVEWLIDAILKTSETNQLRAMETILQAVVGRLSEQQASAVAAKLVDTMLKSTDEEQLKAMGTILQAVAGRLSEQQASAVAAKVVDAALKPTDKRQLEAIGAIFQALAGRLSEQQASTFAAKVADAFLKTTDTGQLPAMGAILQAVASRLSEQQASAVAAKAVDASLKTADKGQVWAMVTILHVAGRLSEQQAGAIAAKLIDAILEPTDRNKYGSLVILRAVAARLSEQQASAFAAKAVDASLKTTDKDQLSAMGVILQAVAGHLSEQQASAVAARVADAILKPIDTGQLMAMGTILRAVAGGLSESRRALSPQSLSMPP